MRIKKPVMGDDGKPETEPVEVKAGGIENPLITMPT